MIRRLFSFTLISSTLISFSQTGPAGVGSSATNVFWLKADVGAYNDAGVTLATNTQSVRQWNDQSGNTKNFSEGTAGQRPTFRTGVINGFPVIRFDGSDDRISNTSITSGNNATFYAVVSYSSLPSSNPGIFQGSPATLLLSTGGADKSVGMWVSNANRPWGRGTQTNSTQRNISLVATTAASTNYIIESNYTGTAINQNVNGTASGTVAYDGTLKSWTEFAIGRQGSETWAGDIAEVIAFNTSINAAQRVLVQNYLSAKYNIGLAAANDVYTMDNAGNGNFDYDVAGIGRVDASNIHNDAQGTGIVKINNPSGLGNGEYFIFGHDNAAVAANDITDIPAGVQSRMTRVWRVSEVGEVGTVDVSLDLAGLGSVTASDLQLIIDTDNDGVFTDEVPVSGAVLVGGTVYKWSGVDIDNGSRFSFGTSNASQTPMPVELTEFYATPENNGVVLNWSTATEKNSDRFEIEKSIDGLSFEKIGTEDSKATNGNSNYQLNYSYTDNAPSDGMSYYRLKQIDFNGAFEYHPIISVDFEVKNNIRFVVFPNPNMGEFSVDFSGIENEHEVLIEMYSMEGKVVYKNQFTSESMATNTVHIVPEEKIRSGQYIVNFYVEGIKYPVKVLVN
ncbi:MAG: T9SS type A sorting domain-containing protein [Bacteroidota bacterium]|nr:T9SS type A sorting domain-containing protein [Bacteroidota bacterium]